MRRGFNPEHSSDRHPSQGRLILHKLTKSVKTVTYGELSALHVPNNDQMAERVTTVRTPTCT